jgi:hypothetical protein
MSASTITGSIPLYSLPRSTDSARGAAKCSCMKVRRPRPITLSYRRARHCVRRLPVRQRTSGSGSPTATEFGVDDRSMCHAKSLEHLLWCEVEARGTLTRPVETDAQPVACKPGQPAFDECLSGSFSWAELRECRSGGDHALDARSMRPERHRPTVVRSARGGHAAVIFNRPDRPVRTGFPIERVCMKPTDPHEQKLAQPSRTTGSLRDALQQLAGRLLARFELTSWRCRKGWDSAGGSQLRHERAWWMLVEWGGAGGISMPGFPEPESPTGA